MGERNSLTVFFKGIHYRIGKVFHYLVYAVGRFVDIFKGSFDVWSTSFNLCFNVIYCIRIPGFSCKIRMGGSRDVSIMVIVSVFLNFQRKINRCMVRILIKISNTLTAYFLYLFSTST